jgi:hypothetical protein
MLYSTSARTSADASGPSLLGWDRVRLIENIERLEITYYGQDSFSGRDVWQERWGYQSVLPKLVRVQLTFPAGDARFWPMLMVKTSPQQKPGCGPDGQSPDCRGAT